MIHPELAELELSECEGLTDFGFLTTAPNLTELHLHACEIGRIPEGIPWTSRAVATVPGACLPATMLTKQGSSFRFRLRSRFHTPEIFGLSSLRTLRLSRNGLKAVPDAIGNLACLQELNLENNALSSLPIAALSQIATLRALLLYGNEDLNGTVASPLLRTVVH